MEPAGAAGRVRAGQGGHAHRGPGGRAPRGTRGGGRGGGERGHAGAPVGLGDGARAGQRECRPRRGAIHDEPGARAHGRSRGVGRGLCALRRGRAGAVGARGDAGRARVLGRPLAPQPDRCGAAGRPLCPRRRAVFGAGGRGVDGRPDGGAAGLGGGAHGGVDGRAAPAGLSAPPSARPVRSGGIHEVPQAPHVRQDNVRVLRPDEVLVLQGPKRPRERLGDGAQLGGEDGLGNVELDGGHGGGVVRDRGHLLDEIAGQALRHVLERHGVELAHCAAQPPGHLAQHVQGRPRMGVDEREKGVGREEEESTVRERLGGGRVRVAGVRFEQGNLGERLAGADDVQHQHPALRAQPINVDAALDEKVESPIRVSALEQDRAARRRTGLSEVDEALALLRGHAPKEGMITHCVGDVGGRHVHGANGDRDQSASAGAGTPGAGGRCTARVVQNKTFALPCPPPSPRFSTSAPCRRSGSSSRCSWSSMGSMRASRSCSWTT
ncbi:hypothetical protein SRU_0312 [Salinibacter ruber DSM 13855]|uniref:Uncharacterized protein n=1 Tax=Salinibacter ruber (strain DSM 13855 / M31) TaxID=309807 RepID=Q2S5S3_SALRD|nr:hypothetical protein SRU_0312 [Salinibacter ruber DSM 13855]